MADRQDPAAASASRPTVLLTQANIRALLLGYKVVTSYVVLAARRV